MPGLALRVTATGHRTFSVRTRVKGRQVRFAIGSYPLIGLADAREQARRMLRDIQLGRHERKEEKRNALTLGEAVPEFITKHVLVKNRDRRATTGCLKRFEPLYDRPLAEIKRGDVLKILDAIMAEGKQYRAHVERVRRLGISERAAEGSLKFGFLVILDGRSVLIHDPNRLFP
jgi:hypothetical protein